MCIRALWAVCVALAMSTGCAFAADEAKEPATKSEGSSLAGPVTFDHRIDSWVHGTITSITSDGMKYNLRGFRMPFASAHCEMMKEIWNRTQNTDAAKKGETEAAIQKAWEARLDKARTQEPEQEKDYAFSVSSSVPLAVFDEGQVRDHKFLFEGRGLTAAPAGAGKDEAAAAAFTWKDLKQGDRVMLGYDSGILMNDAYVVIRRSQVLSKAGDLAVESNK